MTQGHNTLLQKPTDYYVLPKKQLIDYIDDSGFGLGFAIGEAVRQCYKFSRETNLNKKQEYQDGMTWFIRHASEAHGIDIMEVQEIVNNIMARIESDLGRD